MDDIKRKQEANTVEFERTLDVLRYELEKVQRLAEQLRTLAMRARNAKNEN